ncbi:MAG: ribokinase [Cellulomonadaceae bacterium]|jgi:ribokinase|nr:ribokinase [Cellulomonadaceae bacterium]
MTDIVVVGSINADLVTRVERHPQPGETVVGEDLVVMSGGKGANQAVAAALLGAAVRIVGCVGDDSFAAPACAGLVSAGVDTSRVTTVPGPTGVALIAVDESAENTIVMVPGANTQVTADMLGSAAELRRLTESIILLQGEIPVGVTNTVARNAGGRVILNLAPVVPVAPATIRVANPLVVNEHEALGALAVLGVNLAGAVSDPEVIAGKLIGAGLRSVVITLGPHGALVADGALVTNRPAMVRVPAPMVTPVDTTGAGDAFVGALAYRLAEGDTLEEAVRYAVRVGAFAVTDRGAQPSYPTASSELPEANSAGVAR